MPILKREQDLHPTNLLERGSLDFSPHGIWYAMYTRSRFEKQLMRRLLSQDIAFYGPTVARRYRSPSGRLRICHDPLFPNYVFVYGDEFQRYAAVATNCISRCLPVHNGKRLEEDLRTIQRLIETGRPLTPEARLQAGDRVRVRTGIFSGFEGIVIRRENHVRLLVSVDFTQQGASVQLDDCQLENIV